MLADAKRRQRTERSRFGLLDLQSPWNFGVMFVVGCFVDCWLFGCGCDVLVVGLLDVVVECSKCIAWCKALCLRKS